MTSSTLDPTPVPTLNVAATSPRSVNAAAATCAAAAEREAAATLRKEIYKQGDAKALFLQLPRSSAAANDPVDALCKGFC